jgi:hypothetical protein
MKRQEVDAFPLQRNSSTVSGALGDAAAALPRGMRVKSTHSNAALIKNLARIKSGPRSCRPFFQNRYAKPTDGVLFVYVPVFPRSPTDPYLSYSTLTCQC